MDEVDVRAIGVLGVGTMGAGIVQLAAQTGHPVIACDLSAEALEKAQLYVRDGLSRFVGRSAFSEEEAEEHYDRIHWTVSLEDMAGVDVAIEAIVEKVEPKKEVFTALDNVVPPQALLLTNTSSISITDLASATGRPDKVCGTHFFTPPPVREAVEVPRGLLTSDETVEKVKALIISFGKLPIVLKKDVPGFVGNRFLMPPVDLGGAAVGGGCGEQGGHRPIGKEGARFPDRTLRAWRSHRARHWT